MNETLIQYFEWDLEPDCRLWTQAQRQAPVLARLGVTGMWLPPAYKGQGGSRDVDTVPTICMTWVNSGRRDPLPPNTAPENSICPPSAACRNGESGFWPTLF